MESVINKEIEEYWEDVESKRKKAVLKLGSSDILYDPLKEIWRKVIPLKTKENGLSFTFKGESIQFNENITEEDGQAILDFTNFLNKLKDKQPLIDYMKKLIDRNHHD